MRTRCTRILFIFAILALALASPVAAQKKSKSNSPPLLAVVDVQHILSQAEASKKAKKAIEAQRSAYEKELDRHKAELKASQEELRKQKAILAPDAFETKRRNLEKKFNEVRRQTEERRAILNKALNSAMSQLRKEMGVSIAKVMKDKGIELTLPRSAVMVFDNRLDISKEVLAHLNKRLPSIDLKVN